MQLVLSCFGGVVVLCVHTAMAAHDMTPETVRLGPLDLPGDGAGTQIDFGSLHCEQVESSNSEGNSSGITGLQYPSEVSSSAGTQYTNDELVEKYRPNAEGMGGGDGSGNREDTPPQEEFKPPPVRCQCLCFRMVRGGPCLRPCGKELDHSNLCDCLRGGYTGNEHEVREPVPTSSSSASTAAAVEEEEAPVIADTQAWGTVWQQPIRLAQL